MRMAQCRGKAAKEDAPGGGGRAREEAIEQHRLVRREHTLGHRHRLHRSLALSNEEEKHNNKSDGRKTEERTTMVVRKHKETVIRLNIT